MKAKPTPTPWLPHDSGDADATHIVAGPVVRGMPRHMVCTMHSFSMLDHNDGNGLTATPVPGMAEANAALLCRAVNFHERLVTVLTKLLNYEDDRPAPGTFGAGLYDDAEKLLLDLQNGALTPPVALHGTPEAATMAVITPPCAAFVLMRDTVFQGRILSERDGDGKPILYVSRAAAELERADSVTEQWRQVDEGERDEDDVDDSEWVEAVQVAANGDISDEAGFLLANIYQPLPY